MNKAKTTVSLLLAGLMAGGAWAQTASATSDVPVKAGEASTMTQGQPNMKTDNTNAMGAGPVYVSPAPVYVTPAPVVVTPAPVTSASGAVVDSASSTSTMGASSTVREVPYSSATTTSNVPVKAGEASTMTNGVPNMSTQNQVTNDGRVAYLQAREIQRVPQQAGEASTMVGGNPNANPEDPRLYR